MKKEMGGKGQSEGKICPYVRNDNTEKQGTQKEKTGALASDLSLSDHL
nr:hypothetical protein [uncultured Blautia sp.]